MPKRKIPSLEEKKKIDALKAETIDAGHVIEPAKVILSLDKPETERRILRFVDWIKNQECQKKTAMDYGRSMRPAVTEQVFENGRKVLRVFDDPGLSFDEALESPLFFESLYSIVSEGWGNVFSRLLIPGDGMPGLKWTLEPWIEQIVSRLKGGNGAPHLRRFQALDAFGQTVWHVLNAHAKEHGLTDLMPDLGETAPKDFSQPKPEGGISSTEVVNPNNTPEKSQAKADHARGAM